MQTSPGVDRLSPIVWLEFIGGAICLATRLRVTIHAFGVPMMSQMLMQGLVL